jgi:hypothetical protein
LTTLRSAGVAGLAGVTGGLAAISSTGVAGPEAGICASVEYAAAEARGLWSAGRGAAWTAASQPDVEIELVDRLGLPRTREIDGCVSAENDASGFEAY